MNPLRVLIVDDEPGIRHAIQRVLRTFTIALPRVDNLVGFDCEAVESGEAALAALDERPFDLMLLDHKLGGMSGIDVLERLRGRDLDMLVIMITAFATIEAAVRATKHGAFDFLPKPFTPEEMKDCLRKAAVHLATQRQANALAQEKRRVRFDFIRVLGHELKAPLAAIESFLDLLANRVAGEDLAAYDHIVDRAKARTAGMRKLIADLLDMTRIEAGEKARVLTEVDALMLAEEVVEMLRPAADERGVVLSVAGEGPTTMTADRGELEIVLANLVTNAVKYNRSGGRADVQVSGDENWLTLTVRDTGIGLTPEEASRLFKDFSRIRNSKTRDIEGSGLGLSIIKKIADLYSGSVSVASQPDVGSTFTVRLKRHAPPPAAVLATAVSAVTTGSA